MADVVEKTARAARGGISLDDKWTVSRGRVLLSGTQAIARLLIAQRESDRAAGLKTAGYISGYRGSPLGNVDTALWAASTHLSAADISFVPGVNEDLAATAVRGTQQIDFVPEPQVEGVFAAWYGKGPGVDRSLDALKHGNYAGAHPRGGVLILYGDDHGGKSSTVAHHSEQAMAAAAIPSLYPADVGEIISFGLLGYAMSRFSGSWVGMKLVNEVAEQTATVDLQLEDCVVILPSTEPLPPEGVHVRSNSFVPLREEQIVVEHRLPLVQAFVRANRIDRPAFLASDRKLGLVAAGKSFADTRQALALLGLDDAAAAAMGVSLYKVGCIWPLEPFGLTDFAKGHHSLLIVEEKQAILEPQAAQIVVNHVDRPQILGKFDETGAPLLSRTAQLEPASIALAILGRMETLGLATESLRAAGGRLAALLGEASPPGGVPGLRRAPFFCSGCPHSRSTRVPAGSLSMTGIGCHTMVGLVRPAEALLPTHMGGEGANWLGLSRYTGTRHIFQNMGDGTYYHSGLLAIRAAVAADANITYKILYNDAVAMTGGQPVDGPISVAEIAHQVLHEGVRKVILLSDNPDVHRGNKAIPANVEIGHRDDLDAAQRTLRDVPGCTVLIYEQTCAAEKRRRRKRGLYPDPPKRLHIAKAVCEGCGDCSAQSTCVSLLPAPTEDGLKRRIDQNSCNKDYSCLSGYCPSFITVENAELRKAKPVTLPANIFDTLPEPVSRSLDAGPFAAMIAGVGGTGVITVAAILGMAAHCEGHAASLFDMTGLAQKNGAVFSHVRIAAKAEDLRSQRIGRGEADLLLAFDAVAALADEPKQTISRSRTEVIVNSDVTPTMAFQFNAAATVDDKLLIAQLQGLAGTDAVEIVAATGLAAALVGNPIGANLMLIGIAVQRGLLPIGPRAIEQAVRLNGTSVDLNLLAFRLGRLLIADPDSLPLVQPPARSESLGDDVDAIVERQSKRLEDYQSRALAAHYRRLVETVRKAEQTIAPDSKVVALAVARNYARLLAYKDEYEVARLLTDPALKRELAENFGKGARVRYNLAAPILATRSVEGRPGKRSIPRGLAQPLFWLLVRARRLRGSPFDLFGYAAERRHERALIDHYRTLVDAILPRLHAANLSAAADLLSLAGTVRGYGPVKEQARKKYIETVEQQGAIFLSSDLPLVENEPKIAVCA